MHPTGRPAAGRLGKLLPIITLPAGDAGVRARIYLWEKRNIHEKK